MPKVKDQVGLIKKDSTFFGSKRCNENSFLIVSKNLGDCVGRRCLSIDTTLDSLLFCGWTIFLNLFLDDMRERILIFSVFGCRLSWAVRRGSNRS
jgi:hypothetical protein